MRFNGNSQFEIGDEVWLVRSIDGGVKINKGVVSAVSSKPVTQREAPGQGQDVGIDFEYHVSNSLNAVPAEWMFKTLGEATAEIQKLLR